MSEAGSDRNEIINILDSMSQDELERLYDLIGTLKKKRKPTHSILELEGLGKDLWAGTDVEKYINEERESWQ